MTIEEQNMMQSVQKINEPLLGMTLRDYFAGQTLAGIMSNVKEDFGDNPHETIAKICYAYADALLEQRTK